MSCGIGHLNRARAHHDDEYYTTQKQVDDALNYFAAYIRGRKVYCPCDSEKSQFWQRLKARYAELGLAGLVATSWNPDGKGKRLDYDGQSVSASEMSSDGSFDSEESKTLMRDVGFVITNPPFSKIRAFAKTLAENAKGDFAFIYGISSISQILNEIASGRLHSTKLGRIAILGANSGRTAGCYWASSVKELSNEFKPTARFSDMTYEVFDQHNDVINVNRVKDIPSDYAGFMGVPTTAFLSGVLDSGYELIGGAKATGRCQQIPETYTSKNLFLPVVNGKIKFNRLIIRKREQKAERNTAENPEESPLTPEQAQNRSVPSQ